MIEDARRLSTAAATRAADQAARVSYGRLLAYLSARARDVAKAEDALADAFQAALKNWPAAGVPDNPEAWLLTAARRNLDHATRHGKVRAEAAPALAWLQDEIAGRDGEVFPDERLKLLFVCAHPAIDAAARAPLMLQTVLGLDAARIASAFLVSPAAMGQRLVRAKTKIRDAGLRFAVPEPEDLSERLESVLDAIYAAYGSGWEDIAGADARQRGLTEEAIWLARLVVGLLPEQPEARGLLALMLYCESRKAARRTPEGAFVPLAEQDIALWSRPMIDEAERALAEAARLDRMGRFQLEAAIQSAHAQRALIGATPWHGIAMLYEGLVRLSPTTGALVGRAAAVAQAQDAATGLTLLDGIPTEATMNYQPYWALRGHLSQRLGQSSEAIAAYRRAVGLTEDTAVRAFLLAQLAALTP